MPRFAAGIEKNMKKTPANITAQGATKREIYRKK